MSRTYTISPDPFLVVIKEDTLFYFRSVDDDSGVVQKRSRVKAAERNANLTEGMQLTLPLFISTED